MRQLGVVQSKHEDLTQIAPDLGRWKQTGMATDFQEEILRVGSKRPVQLTAHETALEDHHKQDPKERLQPESR